jgi:hypothetical protein
MGTYARIKSQTDRAVSWLVQTASAHGSSVRTARESETANDHLSGPVPAAKQGRLKGKARTDAKKAKEARILLSTDDQLKNATPTYKISTDELIRHARYLGGLGETLIMPRRIWRAYQDAIRGRQKYADRFEAEKPENKGNAGHVYFMDVLRQLVSMLATCVHVQAMPYMSQSDAPEHNIETSGNLFMRLSIDVIEDVSEADSDALEEDGNTYTTSSAEAVARYEPKIDPEEEAQLLWLCFVDDVHAIQDYVVTLWQSFSKGGEDAPSLPATTFLTDAAITQIVVLEETLMEKVADRASTRCKAWRGQKGWTIAYLAIAALRRALNEDWTYPSSVPLSLPRLYDQIGPSIVSDLNLVVMDEFIIQYLMDLRLEKVRQTFIAYPFRFTGPVATVVTAL